MSAADAPNSTAPTLDDARTVLRDRWGYPSFRPGQEEILESVLEGRDVLGVLPTGGGKSLCYQLPSLLTDGFVLVVSPLISLMQDQVASLRARGIEAAFINSTLAYHEVDQRWTDAEHGRYDLVYLAPERLQGDFFRARAERLDVDLLAVDEAHCVSEWGHHFRPAYRDIADAAEHLGRPPVVAVTATATPDVRRDVIDLLDLDDPAEVVRGFDRPNVLWSVFRTENKQKKLRDVVEAVEGSGIVYASTRREVETWTRFLRAEGHTARPYHGGMDASRREAVQTAWVEDDARVIVATNAFGMGIDKPDVRFVVHVALPSSIEAYYQEAGRGGRDGDTAYAVLLFQPPDGDTQEALIDASHPSAKEVREVYDAVCNVGQVPIGAEPDGPVSVNLDAVLKITGFSVGKVRTAVELLERQEAWRVLPQRTHKGQIRFVQPANAVRRTADQLDNEALAGFIRTLLRTVHADAFSDWWRMDLRILEERLDLERERLLRGLKYLEARGLLRWRPPGDALQVELQFPRSRRLPVDDRHVTVARARAEKRLRSMLRYARSLVCRRRFLLTYFGETSPERCGSCDVCVGRHRPQTVTPDDEELLRAILEGVAGERPREDWFDGAEARDGHADPTSYRVDALIDWLIDREYLRLRDPLQGTLDVTEKAEPFLPD